MDGIDLFQDRKKRWTFLNTIMNIKVPQKAGNSGLSYLLHGAESFLRS